MERLCGAARADPELAALKAMGAKATPEAVFNAVQNCLCRRFGIEERTETDFYRLAVISIKSRDLASAGLSGEVLEKRIHQYDCHQTSLVAKMKILFTLSVERSLGLSLDDDAVTNAHSLTAFSQLIYAALKEEATP